MLRMMLTRKTFYSIFALLLMGGMLLQGCGETIEPEVDPIPENTYTLSVVASKAEIGTKALDLNQGTLRATWQAGEKVAVYNKTRNAGLEGYLEAQGSGSETTLKGTLSGTVEANDILTLSFLASNYSEQDGTLAYIAAHCDYATADVTVKSKANGVITPAASASFASRQAIVEFTLKESDGSAIAGGVSKLNLVAGGTTISVVPNAATDVLYVAIPAISEGTLSLSAVDPNGARRSHEETGTTFENGKYYKFGVNMDCIVKDDSDLFAACASRVPVIVLGADIRITRSGHVDISGASTIDLSGHSITGYAVDNVPSGRIFYVDSGKSLTLNGPGTLKGGHAEEGGAICNRGTLTLKDVTITECSARRGGAIYNEGTLNMSGTIVARDNTGENNAPDNVYLASGTVITVTGPFTAGTFIGVTLADGAGNITSNYAAYNGSTDPLTVFSPDASDCYLTFSNGEAGLEPGCYYKVIAEKDYATLQAYLDETGRDLSAAQTALSLFFPNRNTSASAVSFTYRSADPQGYPVELSALLLVPDAALEGTKDLSGICLTNHGTIASNAECPTMRAQIEGALTWRNFALVMPDYYGFGASADRPQAFLDAETTARGNIDAYLAAVQLLKDREVRIPDKLFSFGYSQGGFNSMANLKYVSKHPELSISFDKVMCGGSPFDVELTWDAYTQGTFRNAIAFIPITVVSINESQQLGLAYSDLFKGKLLENWRDWILSKKYSTDWINNKLGTNDLSEVMSDGFMARTGEAYNAIKDVCHRYSLTSGWVPSPETQIILYHSRQDDTVPYDNLTAMKDYLDQVAPGCYTASEGNNGGHINAIIRFVSVTISAFSD